MQHPQRAQFSPKSAAPIGISSLQEGFTPSKPVWEDSAPCGCLGGHALGMGHVSITQNHPVLVLLGTEESDFHTRNKSCQCCCPSLLIGNSPWELRERIRKCWALRSPQSGLTRQIWTAVLLSLWNTSTSNRLVVHSKYKCLYPQASTSFNNRLLVPVFISGAICFTQEAKRLSGFLANCLGLFGDDQEI